MATVLLAYADDTKLSAAETSATQAAITAAAMKAADTDASSKPLAPTHPLLARNPGFHTSAYVKAFRVQGKAGGLLTADTLVQAALGASEVSSRTVAQPTAATSLASIATYVSALTATIPTVDPAPKTATVTTGDTPP